MANADAVVVELIADVKGLTPTTNKAANDFDQAMNKIGGSADKAAASIERMSNRSAAATRNLGRQVADIGQGLATGQSPFLIMAQQSGQVADALADTGGAAAKVAAFFAGPWGAAILAAASAGGILLGNVLKLGDAIDKQVKKLEDEARQAEVNRAAHERFKGTLEGVTEAIHDQTDALKKQVEGENTSAEQANKSAKANLERVKSIRETILQLLKQADAEYDLQTAMAGGDPSGGQAVAKAATDRQAVKDKLAKAEADVRSAEVNLQNTRVNLAQEEAVRMADPLARINKLYDDKAKAARDAARKEAAAGKEVTGVLTAQLGVIEKGRQAALKAERERESAANRKGSPSANDQIGRQINVAEATRIVESAGGRVTSGYRSTERQAQLYADYKAGRGNLAAPPGSSLHEIGQAVDVAKTAGLTIAKLKRAFEAEGVRITELLDEGDHYHVGFGKKTSSQAADDAAKAAEKAREADVRFGNSVEATAKRIEGLYGKGEDARFAEQFRSVFGTEDPLKDSLETIGPKMRGEVDAWNEENQRRKQIQENQIYELSDLYESLFTGGVKGVWDEFKREGLRTLALLLAKWTIAAFTKQADGGNFSDLIKGVGSAASSLFSNAPGRASGGPVEAGRLYRINEAASGGRVEGFVPSTSGKVIPLGSMKAATSGGGITVLQTVSVDARGSVMNDQFAQLILARADQNAKDISSAYSRGAVEAAPGRVARTNTLGS